MFHEFNDGTHGNAGRFNLRQLQAIKRRVEDAVRFVARSAAEIALAPSLVAFWSQQVGNQCEVLSNNVNVFPQVKVPFRATVQVAAPPRNESGAQANSLCAG